MRDKLFSLMKDSAQLYVAQLVGLLVGFGVSLVVARLLGPDGRGAYGWIMSLFMVAIPLGQVGTDILNRRLAAQQPQLARTLAGTSIAQAILWGGVVALAMLAFGLSQSVGQSHVWALVLAASLLPLNMSQGLLGTVAAGLGRFKDVAGMELTQKLTMAAGVALVAMVWSLDVWHLLAVQGIALAAACWFVGRRVAREAGWPWCVDWRLLRQHRALMLGAFAANVSWILLQRVDVIMLGIWRPLAETGYYTVALSLIDAMVVLPGVIAMVLMNRVAAETDTRERWRFLLIIMVLTLSVFAIVCALVAWVAPWLIPFLFGANFVDTVPVFERLLIAAWLMAGYQLAQNAVAGYGRARYQMLAPFSGLLVKVGFGWMFISHGVMAAANATVLAYATAFAVAMAVAVWGGAKRA
ncbi:MAG: oligosaccharide flippase family protein [Pseudomonadaceae bacterium]|nr:oligosaccharide flippase family protein [Pseudomonadaceae bacterium]